MKRQREHVYDEEGTLWLHRLSSPLPQNLFSSILLIHLEEGLATEERGICVHTIRALSFRHTEA